MAFRLVYSELDEVIDGRSVTFNEYFLSLYDTIVYDEDSWSDSWDDILYARSALEFVRDQLPPERAALLDKADAFWKAHPREFNHAFRYFHARKKLAEELAGWVEDENGDHPRIPLSHWWWWPLAEGEKATR